MVKKVLIFVLLAVSLASYSKDKKVIKGEKVNNLDYNYTFNEATKQYLLGNFKQALILYSQCIRLDNTIPTAYYQISQIYNGVGDVNTALEYGQQAVLLDNSNNLWYRYNVASLYTTKGVVDSAVMVYKDIVKHPNSTLNDRYTLASLYLKAGKYRKAKSELIDMVKQYGLTEDFAIALHKLYREQKKESKAIEMIDKLISYDSLNIKYYGILAEYYEDLGEIQKAEKYYNKMLLIDDEDYLALLSTAQFYKGQKNFKKSFGLYADVIVQSNATLDIKLNTLVEILSERDLYVTGSQNIYDLISEVKQIDSTSLKVLAIEADYYIKQEKYTDAISKLQIITGLDPKNYMFWEQILYLQNLADMPDSILNTSSNAIKYFPGQPTIYLFKSIAEIQLEKYNSAIVTINEGLKHVDSGDKDLTIQFYTFLGDVYHNLDLNEKSDSIFDEVLKLDPENTLVLNNYSYYLSLRSKNLEYAQQLSKKAVEKEPENTSYLDTYAWILYKQDKFKEALSYIHRAYEMGGQKNAEILEHYGDILLKLNRSQEAKEMWKRAYNINKDSGLSDKINAL